MNAVAPSNAQLDAAVGALAAFTAGLVAAEQLRGPAGKGDAALPVGIATFVAVVVTMTALELRSVRRCVQFHRDA